MPIQPTAVLVPICIWLAAGCFGGRALAPAEVTPLQRTSPPREPLPDLAEETAARIAARSLANDREIRANGLLSDLREVDESRRAEDQPVTGLYDNALDAVNAASGEAAYRNYAEKMLTDGNPDPALRLKLERILDSDPLAVAERRLSEDLMRRFGSVFNQISGPAARMAMGNPINAIATGRAALLSLLVLAASPEISTQQRQALRALQTFLDRNPESPEADRIARLVDRYASRLRQQRIQDAQGVALRAMDAGRPDAALLHLGRAERIDAADARTQELKAEAQAALERKELNLRRSLRANAFEEAPFVAVSGSSDQSLSAKILKSSLSELAQLTIDGSDRALAEGLDDELDFLSAAARLNAGDEDGFFEAMQDHARRNVRNTNMGRHAVPIITRQNPYAAFRSAERTATRRKLGWLFLGPRAQTSIAKDVPGALQPIVWLVDVPRVVINLVRFPIRLLQYPMTTPQFDGRVLEAGEAYVQQFPNGSHEEEVRKQLESMYAARGQWSQALAHHRERRDPDPRRIATYRERIAERTLEAARGPRRPDVRISLYRSVMNEYGETEAARKAASELKELRATLTPQAIRVSRGFLIENPELTEPGALGLRAELLDGDEDNGELADDGILLIGRTYVRILLRGRPRRDVDLGAENFKRFVALLEQAYDRNLRADSRERPVSDPQRDLFFERARLGLLDETDFRLSASSSFAFLSRREKFGGLQQRRSILPVELVVRGGLEDFGVAAVPRIRVPTETEDAFLYK